VCVLSTHDAVVCVLRSVLTTHDTAVRVLRCVSSLPVTLRPCVAVCVCSLPVTLWSVCCSLLSTRDCAVHVLRCVCSLHMTLWSVFCGLYSLHVTLQSMFCGVCVLSTHDAVVCVLRSVLTTHDTAVRVLRCVSSLPVTLRPCVAVCVCSLPVTLWSVCCSLLSTRDCAVHVLRCVCSLHMTLWSVFCGLYSLHVTLQSIVAAEWQNREPHFTNQYPWLCLLLYRYHYTKRFTNDHDQRYDLAVILALNDVEFEDVPDLSDGDDDGAWDDGGTGVEVRCLFCDGRHSSPEETFSHCRSQHRFDIHQMVSLHGSVLNSSPPLVQGCLPMHNSRPLLMHPMILFALAAAAWHWLLQFNALLMSVASLLANESKTNPKLFFNYINSKRIKTENVGPLKNSEERMVVDDEEKANILNTFFSTVFTLENEMLGEIPRNNENPILRVTNLTQEEVRNRLNKIKIDKSPGPDGIHPRVLRELSLDFYGFVKLINFIRSTSCTAESLANVTGPKPWDKEEFFKPVIPDDGLLQYDFEEMEHEQQTLNTSEAADPSVHERLKQMEIRAEEAEANVANVLQELDRMRFILMLS
ncbi:unnamed protein product, partial [Ranitomeya imitator]